jgi:hypothetical protein
MCRDEEAPVGVDFQPRRRILLRDSTRRGKRAVRTVKGEGEDPYPGML